MSFKISLQNKLLVATTGALGVVILAALAGFLVLWGSVKTFDETSRVSIGNERAVRDLTLMFKQQVQEWKDVLLRGKDPAMLDKYWTAFTTKEAAIHEDSKKLLQKVTDPKARDLIVQFLKAHTEMSAAYRRGLQAYKDGGADSAAADAVVKGVDRAPTQMLEKAATEIQSRAELTLQDGFSAAGTAIEYSIAAMLLVLALALLGMVWMVRTITDPIKQLVAA
ncbi:MAG: methyl-accepting chemotaxis protein, partial [Burkholderiales bacterium]